MNRLLDQFGYRIVRTTRGTERPNYEENFAQLKNNLGGFEIFREPRFLDAGHHPEGYVDHECAFASRHTNRTQPKRLLDLGPYRHFIIGLLAHYQVTTVDIRSRKPASNNEVVTTSDAKKLVFHDNVFDVVVSLCALEHSGLTRYGDEFDPEADGKAMNEMIRVLKTGGHLNPHYDYCEGPAFDCVQRLQNLQLRNDKAILPGSYAGRREILQSEERLLLFAGSRNKRTAKMGHLFWVLHEAVRLDPV